MTSKRGFRRNFNPRSSYEERRTHGLCVGLRDISIHAPHTKSDIFNIFLRCVVIISIHAPHTKSDLAWHYEKNRTQFQSTLLIRRATPSRSLSCLIFLFQSTLLIRRATVSGSVTRASAYFNPRSSYEERPLESFLSDYGEISIHAPHTKSDIIPNPYTS